MSVGLGRFAHGASAWFIIYKGIVFQTRGLTARVNPLAILFVLLQPSLPDHD